MKADNFTTSSFSESLEDRDDGEVISLLLKRVTRFMARLVLGVITIIAAAFALDPDAPVTGSDGRQKASLNDHVHLENAGVFAPDGKHFASWGMDQTVRIWDVNRIQTRPDAAPVVLSHDSAPYAAAFSPDGAFLASVGRESLSIWALRAGHWELKARSGLEPASSVAFSPDNQTIAAGGDDGCITLHNATTGEERALLRGHSNAVRNLSFSPDGRLLASAGQDSQVILWDVARGVRLRDLCASSANPVRIVTFSPDGQTIAAGEVSMLPAEIILFDAASGSVRKRLAGHEQGVRVLAFAPDGETLASGGTDGTIKLWNVAHGNQRTVRSQVGDIDAFAFSTDGAWLTFVGDGGIDRRLKALDDLRWPTPPCPGSVSLTDPREIDRIDQIDVSIPARHAVAARPVRHFSAVQPSAL